MLSLNSDKKVNIEGSANFIFCAIFSFYINPDVLYYAIFLSGTKFLSIENSSAVFHILQSGTK